MFNPSQADVRQFFCETWAKAQTGAPLQAIEQLAQLWMDEHPQYHAELADLSGALGRMTEVDAARENPFLHLAMHLTISEQCSIDQPRGIRSAVERLVARLDDLHAAQHAVMDCLGRMVWESQRSGQPPDGEAYLACVARQ